jgi:PLP dependent protein
MISAEQLRDNLARVQEAVAAAARRSGRKAEEITLIGVTKTQPAEALTALYQAGLRHFGENRVQEWEAKRGTLENLGACWHLIGHLQSNKAVRAAKLFHSVDSVDDLALARRLARARSEQGPSAPLRVLIEVHVGGEETKSGVQPPQLPELAKGMADLPHLALQGLMCIPPFVEKEQVRPYFRQLRELRDDTQRQLGLELPVLSMGMSHDFEAAIEEGATEVRIGTALFGARQQK